MPETSQWSRLLVLPLLLGLAACGGDDDDDDDDDGGETPALNVLPDFVVQESITASYLDGTDDDLLTAGLGLEGIQSTTPPGYADPLAPTVSELRRNAIYANYRALQDTTSDGGFGRLFGPGDTPVSGWEYLAYSDADDVPGTENIAMMVQVPDSFDPEAPCVVTAASSGSRGVYGAIGTAGEWGLTRGCAVVYTDKGTGTGFHDLMDDTGFNLQGEVIGADQSDVHFAADLSDADRQDFNTAHPQRFAVKHAHSGLNAWSLWGQSVLQSVEFGLWVLNELYADTDDQGHPLQHFDADNTVVIASSVSNGGGAAIQAAELDEDNLIDGVAVSEPNVQPLPGGAFAIIQGEDGTLLGPDTHSRSLVDYTTLINLYQPCASRAADNLDAPFNVLPAAIGEARCAALQAAGLLSADTLEAQAVEAQAVINDYGINVEQNSIQPSYDAFQVPTAVAVLYTIQHGAYGVEDNLCGLSYGATDATTGAVIPLPAAQQVLLFATSNGVPPTGGVNLINNDAPNGPVDHRFALSTSGLPDRSLDAMRCIREEALGERVADGVAETRVSGDLQGKPTLIVSPRNDAILPINHVSRPYYALSLLNQGTDAPIRYYEVKNAQHLDAFAAFPGFNETTVPVHYYFIEALDLMLDHLRNATPLPPSQVLQTVPRGEDLEPLEAGVHLPPIAEDPAENQIEFLNGVLRVPD